MNILVVDDDREVREMLKSMFIECTEDNNLIIDLREYECGNDAKEDLSSGEWIPEIASVDFMMDNGDGIDLVKFLKGTTSNIPILVITAWPEAEGFKTIINDCVIVSKTDIDIIDETISQEIKQLIQKD